MGNQYGPPYMQSLPPDERERIYRIQFERQVIQSVAKQSSGMFLTGIVSIVLALINIGREEVLVGVAQIVLGIGMIAFVRSIGRIPARRSVIILMLIFGIAGLWNIGLALAFRLAGLGIALAILGAFQLRWTYQLFNLNKQFDKPKFG
jgi:hypothetical protein